MPSTRDAEGKASQQGATNCLSPLCRFERMANKQAVRLPSRDELDELAR